MPQTLRQWEDSLRQPALCELLPVRDYLDGCIIRTNGCFVAGYEASGLNTFFHADETRNRTKEALEVGIDTRLALRSRIAFPVVWTANPDEVLGEDTLVKGVETH